MADQIPALVKQDPAIGKCASRAAQLEKARPIAAYWCDYWIVNQILKKGLHQADEDVLAYTTKLMDKLEQIKSDYASEDAVMDDTTGQAYIEQFAQEVLDRAERAVKANKVTQNTAMTFDAAATFLDLVRIWGEPDAEAQQKIKYAKWNTARILKAIRNGEDPNESNPKLEEPSQAPVLDANDPEVQQLGQSAPQAASVEDVPDADLTKHQTAESVPYRSNAPSPAAAQTDELELPGVPSNLQEPQPSPQPDYFPQATHQASDRLNNATKADDDHSTNFADHDNLTLPSAPSSSYAQAPSAPAFQPPFAAGPPSPTFIPSPAQHRPPSSQPTPPLQSPQFAPISAVSPGPTATTFNRMPPPPAPRQPAYSSNPVSQSTARPAQGPFNTDDAAVIQAQKHAKWAISALNFEDVPTAVRELRKALETLGA